MVASANFLSALAAFFMSLGVLSRTKRGVFICQLFDSLTLGVSQVLLSSFTGAVSLAVGVVRNFVILAGKFTLPIMLVFCFLTVGLGLIFNTGGLFGLIPIIATLVLTVGSYYAEDEREIKFVAMMNLFLWSYYSFMIADYVTGITNLAVALVFALARAFDFSKWLLGTMKRRYGGLRLRKL